MPRSKGVGFVLSQASRPSRWWARSMPTPTNGPVHSRGDVMTTFRLSYIHEYRDRHGKLRRYFKRKGGKGIPLPGLPGSDEFMAAYRAAEAGVATKPEIGASRTDPGTINALCVLYYKSVEWDALVPDSQRRRRNIIEAFRVKNGNKPFATIKTDDIRRMMGLIENVYERWHWLKVIRALFKAGVPSMRLDDPTIGISVRIPKTKGHIPWSGEEIQQYRNYWRLGTQQRLVLEFALEALSRRCEVVRLGPQHVKDGRIRIERAKGSADVDIQLTPELAAAIEAMPKEQMVYVTTDTGKPRSVTGLGQNFAKWATQAGLPKRCRLHGLKKSGMIRLVEAGATAHELMAVSGHRSLEEAQHYTEDFDRKGLADRAIKKRIQNA